MSLRVLFILITLAAVTASSAQAARPVGRWDVVPDQLIESTFNVGVVAFHVEGVRVEFRVNGSLVHTALNPTYNERTDVWEYWFALNPADYADGPLTLDARAVCLNDIAANPAYDLPSLTLYANSGGELGSSVVKWVDAVNGSDANPGTEALPYKTLAMGVSNTPPGGTVNLAAGVYDSQALGGGHTRAYWTTVRAAPGVERDDVLVGPGRPSSERLKWTGLTLYSDSTTGTYSIILTGENGRHSVWLDDCKALNRNGRYAASTNVFGNKYIAYVTGGLTTQVCNGPGGALIRNHAIESITSDAFSGGQRLVVNSVCTDINPGSTGAHPDFHQSYAASPAWVDNVILYNVRGYAGKCQGLFGSRLRNSAFVNVLFERVEDTAYYSQYSGPIENVLFLHVNIINQTWNWREESFDAQDVVVRNSIFGSMQLMNGASADGLDIDTNHFSGTNNMGANVTTGSPEYADPGRRDYRVLATSPAYGSGAPLQCVPADVNGDAFDATSPNRGCYAGAGQIPLPTPDAGNNRTVIDADENGYEIVLLDGSNSLPIEGETITDYLWMEGQTYIGCAPLVVTTLTLGTHAITLEVTDSSGATASDEVVITVEALAPATPGDADGDGDVDINDFVILKNNFGAADAARNQGDFDGDGDVDINDFVILKNNFGTTAP